MSYEYCYFDWSWLHMEWMIGYATRNSRHLDFLPRNWAVG